MEVFDVCVIGNELSAYAAVSTLHKNGHSVAHIKAYDHPFEDAYKPSKGLAELNIEEGHLGTQGISLDVLTFLGINETIKTTPISPFKEILSDGRVLSRQFNKDAFKRYFLRHFPQEANAIERYFSDLATYYHAYRHFWVENDSHSHLDSLPFYKPLKTLSLQAWLDQYFKDQALKESMHIFSELVPSVLSEINALEYLLIYFFVIEEEAETVQLSFSKWLKLFKKASPASYFNSAYESVQFNGTEYTITLKNKETFKARFILGKKEPVDARAINYRTIDFEVNLAFYEATFEVPIHFRTTPLFDYLRLTPMHTIQPKKKGFVRMDVVAEADKDLLITFIDRQFKNFEASIRTVIERPTRRKTVDTLDDEYALFNTLKFSPDLWDAPKWMQVSLNDELKVPLIQKLIKGVYFGSAMSEAIDQETHPDKDSWFMSTVHTMMLKMQVKKKSDVVLAAGHQTVAMRLSNEGASLIDHADTTISMAAEELLQWSQNAQYTPKIDTDEMTKKWFLDSLKMPVKTHQRTVTLYSMIVNAFVIAVLWFLKEDAFAVFGFGAWLIFKEGLYAIKYRTFTQYESWLGIGMIVLGFIHVVMPFNVAALWVAMGVILYVSIPHYGGFLTKEFTFDPIRQKLSNRYLKMFNQRMSFAISLSFILLGLAYFMTSWVAPVILFAVSALFLSAVYYEDKRFYIMTEKGSKGR